jgi:hypothetical protein
MQVEKQHYWIKLLLIILMYMTFSSAGSNALRIIVVVIINFLLFQETCFNYKSVSFTLILGTIFEILSLDLIGIFYLKYLLINFVCSFFKENFKTLDCTVVFFITIVSFALIASLEVMIKEFSDCNPNHLLYKIVAILTVISINIVSCAFKSKVYRHLK